MADLEKDKAFGWTGSNSKVNKKIVGIQKLVTKK